MLLWLTVGMLITSCVRPFPRREVEKEDIKSTADYKLFEAIHLRKKRQCSEQSAYNRCNSPTYNAVYPYRNIPFYNPGSGYYAGPYLERPFAGNSGLIYDCPFSYCLHRNTGYLQALFNRLPTSMGSGMG